MRDAKSEILEFWFEESQPRQWFQKSDEFDQSIRDRFLDIYKMGVNGMLDDWQNDANGILALIILLDQFPRNMFRGDPKTYASDERALELANIALKRGFDQMLPPQRRHFVYMPFMHSEDLDDQEKSVELFAGLRSENPVWYEYALKHRDDIARYGRFPYRNEILGRENTKAETEYLQNR